MADPVHRLEIRKLLPARREEVFDAWLDPRGLAVWMCPGDCGRTTAEIDARVGGRFHIVMHGPSSDYDHRGVYRVLDRPSKLVFTWISVGTEQRESVVTVELVERGEQTELVLTHEGLPSEDSVGKHRGGWGSIAEKLAAYVG